MRLIPGKTKVKIELFKGITLADVIVGLIGAGLITLCTISSLPGRWIIAMVMAAVFVVLLLRLDEEPIYLFVWHMLRYRAYPRRYVRIYDDEQLVNLNRTSREEMIDAFYNEDGKVQNNNSDNESPEEEQDYVDENADESNAEVSDEEADEFEGSFVKADVEERAEKERIKQEKKQLKALIKEENRILKSKTSTEEEKDAVWRARAERTVEKKKRREGEKEKNASYKEMSEIMPFTGINGEFIEYDGKYYGSVIEISPIEFRFFSEYRRNNIIENCLGKVLRGLSGDYGVNIVKIQRPIIYDKYLDAEYDKLDQLKLSYESGLLSEEELQARVEIQYDRINDVISLCGDDKVIEAFYYIVFFESDKKRLDVITRQAIMALEQGELSVRRIKDKDLAIFLKYTNTLDFDEKQIDNLEPEQWVQWAMPKSLTFNMRKCIVDGVITHNMRTVTYPTVVGDAWLAGVMSFPSTKVVVKATPMDRTKAIRAIDRSLSELRGQYVNTNIDSKMLELQEHIETLSQLLLTLQQDNENLLSVSIYITAYDGMATQDDPVLSDNFDSLMPFVSDMKRTVRRSWSEAGMRVSGMDFMQLQGFIGSQISSYDPLVKESRGMPTNTIAGMFPWIYSHISDEGGIKLGSSDSVPVFIDFFRRDSERVNSNMVIVGKSGSGKSYATKSLLTNLASEDAKIFILDPENEYSELAHTLHGKVINVGNAKYGRLNPFHIITALDDDEAGESGGGPGGSFATHLQFLEEFFRQILPDIDKDALEYLNSLVERMYLDFNITAETDLSTLTAEDYPIFDDLYDLILVEFERTNNEFLRQLLRSLVNYISKFSTGGRNANIWNGPSTITTEENFSVFNFQSMLANRNSTIANAQMLLVLKYIDNEIIKNRDYNLKYKLNRKIVVVIDEAHVFIDSKFPVALDFMFQLAKRIRKYNGMQIVITQNIKDFVGSEEIARKSTAIINACQYSFVFGLAPNDMDDLCKLYEKAGGINEREQEDILNAKRGQAFTIMSPTSRSSFMIEVPESFVDMFENKNFISNYFSGDEGAKVWESFVKDSRASHDTNFHERKALEHKEVVKRERKSNFNFTELSESEAKEHDALNTNEISDDLGTEGVRFEEVNESDILTESGNTTANKRGNKGKGSVEKFIEVEEQENAERMYSQSYIDDTLNRFKDSIRKEMEDELVEKIKWLSLGAGLNQDAVNSRSSSNMDSGITTADMGAATNVGPSVAASTVSGYNIARTEVAEYKDEDDFGEDGFLDEDDYQEDYEEEFESASITTETSDDEYSLDDSEDSLLADSGEDYYSDSASGDYLSDLPEDDYSLDSPQDDYSLESLEDEYPTRDFDENDSMDDASLEDTDDDMNDEFDRDLDDGFDRDLDDEFDDLEDDFSFDLDDPFGDELSDDSDDNEEEESTPFLFAELLAEAAEEYANMGIEERLDDLGEDVIEITLEELTKYIKDQRKKK